MMLAALAIASLGAQQRPTPVPGTAYPRADLSLERVGAGFVRPLFLTSPPEDHRRVFVVEKPGIIRIIRDGQVLPTPFLDIEALVEGGYNLGDERGLTALAFHPQYATNRFLYVCYTAVGGTTTVARYTVTGNPEVADPTSSLVILSQSQANPIHNATCLQFGPEGYLYVALGDGGPGHDPLCNAQNGLSLQGKLLRLDVNNGGPYAIPLDNPFVGNSSFRPEIWAYGLRNPWRFTFDRATGDLYLADVGQENVEEINFQPAGSGGGANYGWNIMEGTNCHGGGTCTNPPPCWDPNLVPPIHEYPHGAPLSHCSVIGGAVYRGCAIPDLRGTYFYADFCSRRIFTFRYDSDGVRELTDRTAELAVPGLSLDFISSFGEDASGELYICDHDGEVFKIVNANRPAPPVAYCSGKTSSTGCVPFVTTTGVASLSSGTFNVIGNDFIKGQTGYYIYGPEKGNQDFHAGKLCVKVPFRRLLTGIYEADAILCKTCPGTCRGFRRDFNALIQSGQDPALTCGAEVCVQIRQRDPLDPTGYGDVFSNAVRFTIGP